MDLNTLGKFVYSSSSEWLARKLSNPKRDQDLQHCVAKMKSSWKFAVFTFATEYAASNSLFRWSIYHIELSQRPSRAHLPGHDQNEPLVLLIFCAKSDHIAQEGMHMQRNMGHGGIHMPAHATKVPVARAGVPVATREYGQPLPPPSPDSGVDRPRRSEPMFCCRPTHDSNDSSSCTSAVHLDPRRQSPFSIDDHRHRRRSSPLTFERAGRRSSPGTFEQAGRSSSRIPFETAGRKIKGDERISETKQSDAEIIDQILREYTTFGDGDALSANVPSAPPLSTTNNEPGPASSPVEQSSINGRANAADGNSDAP